MSIVKASLCLLALLTWVSASQSACPTSHVRVFGSDTYPTTPTFDHPYAKYDLPAGTIHAHVYAFIYSSEYTLVEANDEYWLEGPASNDPISFSANLHVTGTAGSNELKTPNYCTGSGISGGLQSGAAGEYVADGAAFCHDRVIDLTATLPLQKNSGEVFPLTVSARANANSDEAIINGVLTFSVPAGYTVRSCHGFLSSPTPALNRSWGNLKAAYR